MDDISLKRWTLGLVGATSFVLIVAQIASSRFLEEKATRNHKQLLNFIECIQWVSNGGEFIYRDNGKSEITLKRSCSESSGTSYVYGYEYTPEFIRLGDHSYQSIPEGIERRKGVKDFAAYLR